MVQTEPMIRRLNSAEISASMDWLAS